MMNENKETSNESSPKKKTSIFVVFGFVIVVGIILGVIYLNNSQKKDINTQPSDEPEKIVVEDKVDELENEQNVDDPAVGVDPLNTTYTIDGISVTLQDGEATMQTPNSSEIVTTRVWGTPTYGDLRGESDKDAAVILEQTGSGSGIFYYVAASLNTPQGYLGTNAEILGDRIAIQNKMISDQTINVNYADRNPGEPMTTRPSVGVSKYYMVEGGKLVETNP